MVARDPLCPAYWPEDREWALDRIDLEAQAMCVEFHKSGVYVDQERRYQLEQIFTQRYKRRERRLIDIMSAAGVGTNLAKAVLKGRSDSEHEDDGGAKPGSYDQLRDLLYDKWDLGIPHGMDTEDFYTDSGLPGTGDKVLRGHLASSALTETQREFIEEMRGYRREKNKVVGTMLSSTALMSNPDWLGRSKCWDQDGRVHSNWSADRVANARLACSQPNCFSGDTEILTENGWIRFDALPRDVRVAQWDAGLISFVEPLDYIEREQAEMLDISLTQISLRVTPDHRCLLRHRKTGELRVFSATEYPEDWQQVHAGMGDGELTINANVLRLIIAIQADATIRSKSAIKINLKKQRKIDRFSEILAALGVDLTWKEYTPGWKEAYVSGPEIAEALSWLDKDKCFGPWVTRLSRESLDVFTAEVMLWDGCATRGSHYASKHKINADMVQVAFTLSGRRARVRRYVNAQGSVSWQVDVTQRDYSLTTNRAISAAGIETAYCVTVPSSYIVVRHDNCVSVTGNCQNMGSRKGTGVIKSIFAAPPGRILIGADLDQAHLKIVANYWGIQRLRDAFDNGWDPHVMLAYDVVKSAGENYGDYPGWPEGEFHFGMKPKKGSAASAVREAFKTGRYTGLYAAGVTLRGGGRYRFKPDTILNVIRATEVVDDEGVSSLPYIDYASGMVELFHATWMEAEPEHISAWEAEMRNFERQGWVADPIFGRRSGLLGGGKLNEVVNYPVLTAEAHVMRIAEGRLRQAFPFAFAGHGTGLIYQCHDSVAVEVPLPDYISRQDPLWKPVKGEPLPPELEAWRRIVEECMTVTVPGWKYPMTAEASVGRTLADI